jgi:hypothetical protein
MLQAEGAGKEAILGISVVIIHLTTLSFWSWPRLVSVLDEYAYTKILMLSSTTCCLNEKNGASIAQLVSQNFTIPVTFNWPASGDLSRVSLPES